MLSQPGLAAAARGDDIDLVRLAGRLDRRAGADILVVPVADDAAEVRMLLQHGLRDGAGLGRIVGRGLVGDDLDLRMIGEDVVVGVELVEVRRGGRLALQDGDLAGLAGALAALLDQRLGLDQADLHPVGADVVVGRRGGLQVDLQDLDAGRDHALLAGGRRTEDPDCG